MERDSSEALCVDCRITLEWNLGKQDVRMWNGFSCLRIGSSGRLL